MIELLSCWAVVIKASLVVVARYLPVGRIRNLPPTERETLVSAPSRRPSLWKPPTSYYQLEDTKKLLEW